MGERDVYEVTVCAGLRRALPVLAAAIGQPHMQPPILLVLDRDLPRTPTSWLMYHLSTEKLTDLAMWNSVSGIQAEEPLPACVLPTSTSTYWAPRALAIEVTLKSRSTIRRLSTPVTDNLSVCYTHPPLGAVSSWRVISWRSRTKRLNRLDPTSPNPAFTGGWAAKSIRPYSHHAMTTALWL